MDIDTNHGPLPRRLCILLQPYSHGQIALSRKSECEGCDHAIAIVAIRKQGRPMVCNEQCPGEL